MDIKQNLLSALAGSSSQNTVETSKLYPLGTRKQVEAALMQLYQARVITCCKITRRGVESIVWWTVGGAKELGKYGKNVVRRVVE